MSGTPLNWDYFLALQGCWLLADASTLTARCDKPRWNAYSKLRLADGEYDFSASKRENASALSSKGWLHAAHGADQVSRILSSRLSDRQGC